MKTERKRLDPYFQRRFWYIITDGGQPIGEVFVLTNDSIITTGEKAGRLRCERRKAE